MDCTYMRENKEECSREEAMSRWFEKKLRLDNLSKKAAKRSVKRGEVYMCNFGCGIGSEMEKNRPAVIVQNDIGNKKSGNTIVIPITHNTKTLPSIACLTSYTDSDGNLKLDGQANASNIRCVSKARLGDLVCRLSKYDVKEIDTAVAKSLGIMQYYAKINDRLQNKIDYISKLKEERNNAQNEIAEIKKILGLSDDISLVEYFQKTIDNF